MLYVTCNEAMLCTKHTHKLYMWFVLSQYSYIASYVISKDGSPLQSTQT